MSTNGPSDPNILIPVQTMKDLLPVFEFVILPLKKKKEKKRKYYT